MKIGVGISIFWREKSDLLQTIRHVVDNLGLRNIEILCEHPFFENWGTEKAGRLKRKIRDTKETMDLEISLHTPYHDLNIASWNLPIRRAAVKQYKECVEMADYLDSRVVVVHPGFVSSRKFSRRDVLKIMTTNFIEILSLAEDLGIVLCLENMASKPKALGIYPRELLKIFEEVDSPYFKFTLDVAHANTTGVDPADFAGRMREHVHHLHLSDNQGKDNHLPIGLGTIDFKRFFKSLGSFKGTGVIEGWAPQYTDHFLSWSLEKLSDYAEKTAR